MKPSPIRIWAIAKAFQQGMSVDGMHPLTAIEKRFLSKVYHIHTVRETLRCMTFADLTSSAALVWQAKRVGVADRQIAGQLRPSEASPRAQEEFSGVARRPSKEAASWPSKESVSRPSKEPCADYLGGTVREDNVRALKRRLSI